MALNPDLNLTDEQLKELSENLNVEALNAGRKFMRRWWEARGETPAGGIKTCDCGHDYYSSGIEYYESELPHLRKASESEPVPQCPVCAHQRKVIRDCLD